MSTGYYGGGYCGANYDRHVEQQDATPLSKLQQQYWLTKQTVIHKIGKRQDEFVVAGDAELDAKLELFDAIHKSCAELMRVIERYQDGICGLSEEENAMGRFLKEQGKMDTTRAGKMMAAVGKSQNYSAQQRLAIRAPLVRLYNEVDTFRCRAISDTMITVSRMEKARTEYRAALLWMKDMSQELDPDTHKQLEKFRKVQNQVRKTKQKFDRLKFDCIQKIDILAASRCNLFSNVLAKYQTSLLQFWQKTSRTMGTVMKSFKGYQHYEFNMLKELTEPSKKLQDIQSERQEAEKESEAVEDKKELITLEEESDRALQQLDRLIDASSPVQDAQEIPTLPTQGLKHLDISKQGSSTEKTTSGPCDLLMDDLPSNDTEKDDLTLLNEILSAPSTPGEENFSKEWQAVFGPASFASDTINSTPGERDVGQEKTNQFMPSQLLDMTLASHAAEPSLQAQGQYPWGLASNEQQTLVNTKETTTAANKTLQSTGPSEDHPKPTKSQTKTGDKSAWFNLFAELDPLSNPDAIGAQQQHADNLGC